MTKKRERDRAAWTAEEEKFLIEHFATKTYCWIAKKLKRTSIAIKSRARRLNLKKSRRLTKAEAETIRDLYNSMPTVELAAKCGVSKATVFNIVRKYGVQDRPNRIRINRYGVKCTCYKGKISVFWSPQMIADLKRMYPSNSNIETAEYFNLSKTTILRKVKELGLKKDPEYLAKRDRDALLAAHAHNRKYGNSGMIKKGEHRGLNTEFKKQKN